MKKINTPEELYKALLVVPHGIITVTEDSDYLSDLCSGMRIRNVRSYYGEDNKKSFNFLLYKVDFSAVLKNLGNADFQDLIETRREAMSSCFNKWTQQGYNELGFTKPYLSKDFIDFYTELCDSENTLYIIILENNDAIEI